MKRFTTWTLLAIGATFTFAMAGCSKPAEAPAPAVSGPATDKAKDDPMAKLSEVDHAAALAQGICPVTDAPLGSMGTPLKVTLEGGRDVFLCCEGCVEELKSDPAKYLAKLDAAKVGGDAKAGEDAK